MPQCNQFTDRILSWRSQKLELPIKSSGTADVLLLSRPQLSKPETCSPLPGGPRRDRLTAHRHIARGLARTASPSGKCDVTWFQATTGMLPDKDTYQYLGLNLAEQLSI
jgi:hypothetical protein